MTPLVDIILLNHNGWRHTIECLESVMRLDYPSFRVILCDNCSTDDSLDRIRAWIAGTAEVSGDAIPLPMRVYVTPGVQKPITFVEGTVGTEFPTDDARVVLLKGTKNAGFAGGNNAALRLSLTEKRAAFAWILNNDTVVASDALSRLVDVASSDERIGAVGCTVLEYNAPETVQLASGGTVSITTGCILENNQEGVTRDRLDRSTTNYNFVTCCSLLGRREALESIGLLDERFFIYGEDGDFGLRMVDGGWRLAYAPDAVLWHKGSATTVRGSAFNDYHQVRSCLLFVHKWRRRRMPLAFAYWTYRGLGPKIWRGQWSRAKAVFRAFSDVVREISAA